MERKNEYGEVRGSKKRKRGLLWGDWICGSCKRRCGKGDLFDGGCGEGPGE